MTNRITSQALALLLQPVEPLLHLSRPRLIAVGFFLLVGHLTFFGVWSWVAPQPYESLALRVSAAMGALPLLFWSTRAATERISIRIYLLAYMTFTGPFLFQWMYYMNYGNSVWMTSVGLMCLLAYQILDWRIATAAVALGTFSARLLVALMYPETDFARYRVDGTIIFSFSWIAALLLAVSTANQRIQRLNATLMAMGVMAHELRTPLASAALIAENMQTASSCERSAMAARLDGLLHAMNHQIDSQIVNAQLLDIKAGTERIAAGKLVSEAVETYPFQSHRERNSVAIQIERDFFFSGTERLFIQVIHNMLKNSIFALRKSGSIFSTGDISMVVRKDEEEGSIFIKDEGPGVPEHMRRFIFEPFFSSQTTYSSGLGLAFCRQTIEANSGTLQFLRAKRGSTFEIRLPVARRTLAIAPTSQRDDESLHSCIDATAMHHPRSRAGPNRFISVSKDEMFRSEISVI